MEIHGAREATDENMAAGCIVDNEVYTRASTHSSPCTHTHSLSLSLSQEYVILFFSTTMVL